jgi:hypothetical protein
MTSHASRLPLGLEPLIAEAERRMRRRRVLVGIATALAVMAAGLTFLFPAPAPGPGVPPLTSSASLGGLRVSVPSGFRIYDVTGGTGTAAPVIGHLLTDFRLPAHRDVWRGMWLWATAKGVALTIQRWFWPLPVGPFSNRLQLPLTLKQPWADGRVGYHWGYLRFHDAVYRVEYWSGPAAPANDRAAILRALESIRPAR